MSHDSASETRDPLFDGDPNPPLPREEFPESDLSTVTEPQTDGSRRCIFYPEEDERAAQRQWLAVEDEFVVSVARWR